MISSGINLVMAVVGFSLSVMFIVFVCTRLICARMRMNASRRSFARASGSDLSTLERSGFNGLEPINLANFPTKMYRELCVSSKDNSQCTVCLSDYRESDTVRVLPVCGHFFHATCIDIWLCQHFTCPVCRISLHDFPERKRFMQPMFSAALRTQYNRQSINAHYCHCMLRSDSRPRSHNNATREAPTRSEGNDISIGEHENVVKDTIGMKIESSSCSSHAAVRVDGG